MIVVRYADDWVAGIQLRDDAERFQRAVAERLGRFGLALHADKTRLIEFGRFARENRRRCGQGKPHTFDSWASRTVAGSAARPGSWCCG